MRTTPSYSDAPEAETNKGRRYPGLSSPGGRAGPSAAERSGAPGRFTSIGTACGGGAGSGVEAYIVSGIRACACERAALRRCSACRRSTSAERRSSSTAADPIGSCASETPDVAPSVTSASSALAAARQ